MPQKGGYNGSMGQIQKNRVELSRQLLYTVCMGQCPGGLMEENGPGSIQRKYQRKELLQKYDKGSDF